MIDPITLSTLWHKLDTITRQMGTIVERSARSPIFTEAHDFSCFLTNGLGQLLAQADGLPIHTGGAAETIKSIIETFEDIEARDIFIANDPYLAAGAHLPDIIIAEPVYFGEDRCFFAGVRGHYIDIGGLHSGGLSPGATEIFQEGLRIPPLRLAKQGVLERDVLDLLLANNREPLNVRSDFEAVIGAIQKAIEFLHKIGQTLGVKELQLYLDEVLNYGERRMRDELQKIPNGEYFSEEKMELEGGCLVSIRARVEIRQDSCLVDFSETDQQIADLRNSPLSNTMSAVYAGLNTIVDPNIPHNEGTYRPVEIIAPKGTIVNPKPPAPVGTCTWAPGIEIIHIIWKALALAVPDRVCGAWGRILARNFSGYDDETGKHFVTFLHIVSGGQGATRGSDGINVISPTNCLGSLIFSNVETTEVLYPLIILEYGFRIDGGGAGEYQGGSGNIVRVKALQNMKLGWVFETPSFWSTFGVVGGKYASPSHVEIQSSSPVPSPLPIAGLFQMEKGDEVTFLHTGGGGWGNPAERSVDLVHANLRDGLITEDFVSKNYPHAITRYIESM
jgi:N-methylhydantoinase B